MVAVDKKREGGTIDMAMPIQVGTVELHRIPDAGLEDVGSGVGRWGGMMLRCGLLSLSLLGMGQVHPSKLHLGPPLR